MSDNRITRLAQVERVLVTTLLFNLFVAVIKILLGVCSGITVILADGLHSIGDTLSNCIGILGVRMSRREPDERFAYGYDRFESIASVGIIGLILTTFLYVLSAGVQRILHPEPLALGGIGMALLCASMVINIVVVLYEGRAGRRLGSKLLIADANETKGDVFVTAGALVGVIAMQIWPTLSWLNGILTIGVAIAIGHVIWEILRDTAKVLGDAQVVDPVLVHAVVMAVPGVAFCHATRTRGHDEDSEVGFFMETHVGVRPDMTIEEAHDDVCHRVKIALRNRWPNLRSALIHLEPNNQSGSARANSVFADRDPYGHAGKGI